MYISGPVGSRSISTTSATHSESCRRAVGLRRHEDLGCAATTVCECARCIEYGRFSAHQPMASTRCTHVPASESDAVADRRSGTTQCPQSDPHQFGRLNRPEAQGDSSSRASGLALRSYREQQTQTQIQEWYLLSGLHRRHRRSGCDRRFAALLACQDSTPHQSTSRQRETDSISQQKQLGTYHSIRVEAPCAERVAGLRTIRQLVRFRKADQICPPPTLARDLRSQMQPQAQRQTARPTRLCAQAPAVHSCPSDRCGREAFDLLPERDNRSSGRHSLRCPRLLLKKASQGEIPGVLHEYGSHSLGPMGLAGLPQAMVVRNSLYANDKSERSHPLG